MLTNNKKPMDAQTCRAHKMCWPFLVHWHTFNQTGVYYISNRLSNSTLCILTNI